MIKEKSQRLFIPFEAEYQAVNACIAYQAARLLAVDGETAAAGIRNAVWHGRMEEIQDGVYLDGAHNELANEDCFREEVLRQRDKMKQMFGKEPKVFRNSSLIYSDEIGGLVASMGFKGMLTEGAKHVLGWKSPHYVYHCNQAPSLKLLLRDFKLSDDISLRFSNSDWAEYPLFADKYINWIDVLPQEEQVINIFMELSSLGMAQPLSSNILEFLKALPECAKAKGITFSTPTEIVTKLKSVSQLDVAYPMSWYVCWKKSRSVGA